MGHSGKGRRAVPSRPGSDARPLSEHVAVVAGATRGAGRGIAPALGEAGATVYCTGRSTRGNPSPYKRRETIEETAELVTAAGGIGISIRVDHTVEGEIQGLFKRIDADQGRLDLLVNSVAGEDPTLAWMTPLAKIDADAGLAMMRHAVLSHLITAKHAAALMMRRKKGLIVEVTEGDTLTGAGMSIMGGVVKTTQKLLAFLLADELRKHRIAAIAITPGFLRSETMLEHFGVTEADWEKGGKKDRHFLESETPLFLGRAVAALAADPDVFKRSGDLTSSWEIARQYGFVDADGRRPDWGAHAAKILPSMMGDGFRRQFEWLDKSARLSEIYAGSGSRKPA